ncbi:MAG: AraC family transcriptional regulator [Rikenellaceae bacterium]
MLRLVSTGVYDSDLNNIETALPFCYLIYSASKPFHVSIRGEVFLLTRGKSLFINKSVPFSVLLDWEGGDNGLYRNDIIGLSIPQNCIIDYNKKYIDNYVYMGLKSKVVEDFIIIDLSDEKGEGVGFIDDLLKSLSEGGGLDAEGSDHVRDAKYNLLFSILRNKNIEMDNIILSYASPTVAEKTAALVMSDYSKNWRSEDLAKHMNMSVSTLKKKMYSNAGSITCFITRLKMVEALRQLRRTDRSINVIAMSLGFSSSSYFTLVFKRSFNILPSEVRRNDGK